MRFLVAFFLLMAGKNIGWAQINHWETAVYPEDYWRYFIGNDEPPANWANLDFSDGSWRGGPASIGYGDGDDRTIIPKTHALYMRHTFTVADKSKLERAILHADYDDGFIAYLNGVEIARANLEGTYPAYNRSTPTDREATGYEGGLPIPYTISNSLIQDILKDGENVLAIQTHNFEGLESSDMTTLYWLSFGIADESRDYRPTPEWFMDAEFESPLPIVLINTNGKYIPDEPKIEGTMGIIWNGNGVLNLSTGAPNEFFGNIAIERRGQTSLHLFPKNGYAIETKDEDGIDKDVSFLNFPEEEDWILHGPYSDKTLIRNVLAMHMARSIGQYASRTRLVELMINEQYEGVYVMMERIKRDKNRVDIAKLNPEEIEGDDLTGGYIFKLDKGAPDWFSQYDIAQFPGQKLRFQYVSPNDDNLQPQQKNYIKAYVDSFEIAMKFPEVGYGGKRYDEYIDLTSFADHFILSELTKNVDAYRISTYMHKDKDSNGGRIKAGPVWDFNLAFGNADYCNMDTHYGWVYHLHCDTYNPFWWGNMFQDAAFVNIANCRWNQWSKGPLSIDSLHAFIDEKAALLAPVVERNFQRWPILDKWIWPNPQVRNSYEAEIIYLKNFLQARAWWLTQNMFGTCLTNTDSLEEGIKTIIQVNPNPFTNELWIQFDLLKSGKVIIELHDALGRKVIDYPFDQLSAGTQILPLKVADKLQKGMYILSIKLEDSVIGMNKVISN